MKPLETRVAEYQAYARTLASSIARSPSNRMALDYAEALYRQWRNGGPTPKPPSPMDPGDAATVRLIVGSILRGEES